MVSSGACSQITPQMTVYAATKSFLDYFARALDFEYRSKGIIVQSLMPFYVATKMTRFSHTLSNPGLLIPSAERYAESAVATLGYTSRTSGYWPHTIQAWFTNWIPEWLWMRGATTLNNALRRQAEQRKAPQSLIKRDSSEFDVSKFSWCSQYKDTFNKRENKVTCDKIEEHLFPVISECVHSGSKPFWISSHPFSYTNLNKSGQQVKWYMYSAIQVRLLYLFPSAVKLLAIYCSVFYFQWNWVLCQ